MRTPEQRPNRATGARSEMDSLAHLTAVLFSRAGGFAPAYRRGPVLIDWDEHPRLRRLLRFYANSASRLRRVLDRSADRSELRLRPVHDRYLLFQIRRAGRLKKSS